LTNKSPVILAYRLLVTLQQAGIDYPRLLSNNGIFRQPLVAGSDPGTRFSQKIYLKLPEAGSA
jgi:hypothetical protein